MGAPFKQAQQLSKIGNGVSDWLSLSDNEHGHLMMSRGTQEHVDCTESSKLSGKYIWTQIPQQMSTKSIPTYVTV